MLLLNASINISRIIEDCFFINGKVQFIVNKLIYMSVICLFASLFVCLFVMSRVY